MALRVLLALGKQARRGPQSSTSGGGWWLPVPVPIPEACFFLHPHPNSTSVRGAGRGQAASRGRGRAGGKTWGTHSHSKTAVLQCVSGVRVEDQPGGPCPEKHFINKQCHCPFQADIERPFRRPGGRGRPRVRELQLARTYCPCSRHLGSLAGGQGWVFGAKELLGFAIQAGAIVWVLNSRAKAWVTLWALTNGSSSCPLQEEPPDEASGSGVRREWQKAEPPRAAPLLSTGRPERLGHGRAIPFSPRKAGWLPIPGSEAHKSWLMVTAKLWAAPSGQYKPPCELRFPAVDPAWGP